LFAQGCLQDALSLQLSLQPLVDALFCEVNPIPVKTALCWMGKCGGTLRLPLVEMRYPTALQLEKALKNYEILEKTVEKAAELC
jgi:4-hydroxy-tetrahydrodipicolinate synthase